MNDNGTFSFILGSSIKFASAQCTSRNTFIPYSCDLFPLSSSTILPNILSKGFVFLCNTQSLEQFRNVLQGYFMSLRLNFYFILDSISVNQKSTLQKGSSVCLLLIPLLASHPLTSFEKKKMLWKNRTCDVDSLYSDSQLGIMRCSFL